MEAKNITPAISTIASLKEEYTGNKFDFDTKVTMRLSGDKKKQLRQEIMEILTTKKLPYTKCSTYALADEMKINFDQLSLF